MLKPSKVRFEGEVPEAEPLFWPSWIPPTITWAPEAERNVTAGAAFGGCVCSTVWTPYVPAATSTVSPGLAS